MPGRFADAAHKLQQRKLGQWTLAYLTGALGLLQVLRPAADSCGWPQVVMRASFGLVARGFVVTLVLAWYHGEQGRQRASSTELLITAPLLAIGSGLPWRFAPHRIAVKGIMRAPKTVAVVSTGSTSTLLRLEPVRGPLRKTPGLDALLHGVPPQTAAGQ